MSRTFQVSLDTLLSMVAISYDEYCEWGLDLAIRNIVANIVKEVSVEEIDEYVNSLRQYPENGKKRCDDIRKCLISWRSEYTGEHAA